MMAGSSSRPRQTTDGVLLVRPARFGHNPETAASNAFQRADEQTPASDLHAAALAEQGAIAQALCDAGVRVHLHEDTSGSPDAIFPNNWLSTHDDGTLVLYPIASATRRSERSPELVARLKEAHGYRSVIDLRLHEERGAYLEGTGSLVLDRRHRVAYACLSARTSEELAFAWARAMGFRCIAFHARTMSGGATVSVYHTNVVMSVGERAAVVCFDVMPNPGDRERVRGALEDTGRRVVAIDERQLKSYCGNLLELASTKGGTIWAMSEAAFEALRPDQRAVLGQHASLVHAPVPTIERVGGGSVRCMLAEIFPGMRAGAPEL
jgi:hypothetical protein